ncbi:hypothetical protein GZL_08226 [Streptomyces sp. 769]|nr:hypothetical protein GZL_08226 [Streptomyces sp. 769]
MDGRWAQGERPPVRDGRAPSGAGQGLSDGPWPGRP